MICDSSCLPLSGANQGEEMIAMLDVAPPSPDQSQQAGAMEAAANKLTVAKAATAASKVDGASSKDAKQAGKAAAVSKAAAAGADTKVVAAAVAAQSDPKKSVATSSTDDAKQVIARDKVTSALVKTTEDAMYAQKKQETSTLKKAGADIKILAKA